MAGRMQLRCSCECRSVPAGPPPQQVLDVRRLRQQLPKRRKQLRHDRRGQLVGQQRHLARRRAAQQEWADERERGSGWWAGQQPNLRPLLSTSLVAWVRGRSCRWPGPT